MCVCISLSAYVTLFCLFSPKLSIILLHPDKNVRKLTMNSATYKRPFKPVSSFASADGNRQNAPGGPTYNGQTDGGSGPMSTTSNVLNLGESSVQTTTTPVSIAIRAGEGTEFQVCGCHRTCLADKTRPQKTGCCCLSCDWAKLRECARPTCCWTTIKQWTMNCCSLGELGPVTSVELQLGPSAAVEAVASLATNI